MAIKVYVDAASNLFNEITKAKGFDIKVIPMLLNINGEMHQLYDESIDIESFSKDFYNKLREGADIKTSLATPGSFLVAFEEEVKNGNQVICFTLSNGISGTYQAASIAASNVNDESGKENVVVIDSMTAGLGEGRQALEAAKLIKEGKSFEEVVAYAKDNVLKTRSEFMVDSVKFLLKTGRVSALAARIASFLSIKPLLRGSEEGKIELFKKCIGQANAINNLATLVSENIADKNDVVYITHCDNIKAANDLKDKLVENGINNIEIYYYDLITGTHVGPGTVAVFYKGYNRNVKKGE